MKKITTDSANEAQTFSRRDALRIFGGAGLGVLLANTSPAAAQTKTPGVNSAQKGNLQGAGFFRFKVGELECVSVSDGYIPSPAAEFFAAPAAEIESILRDNFLPVDKLTLYINTLIVKSGGKTILMDTGAGKNIGPTGGFLPVNLERAKIKPADITDIVFSHAHLDHIGGNFKANKQLFFPNAKFHIAQKEWDEGLKKTNYFGGRTVDKNLSQAILDAIDKDLAPLKNRISFFSSETEIAPGVKAIPAYGHTPGHSIYEITSGAESLLFVGDLIHHAAVQLTRPDISMFGDSFPPEAKAARLQILERIAREKQLMMGAHFPFPGIGHLRPRSEKMTSYEWVPLEWQW